MTEKQFIKKTEELIKRTADRMRIKRSTFLKSGAVNMADYENDYRLPKIVMLALCKEACDQWMPLSPDDRNTARNLSHFV